MQLVTDLGDQGVILPLIGTVLGVLLILGERRAALWWTLSVCIALGITLAAKLVLIPCGHLLPVSNVRSPSGHAASASAVYGGVAMLVVQAHRSAATRVTAFCLAVSAMLAIAATRVLLRAHTLEETVIGVAIGCLGPILLMLPNPLFRRGETRRRWWLLLLPLVAIPAVAGHRLGAEGWIHATSFWLAHLAAACGQ